MRIETEYCRQKINEDAGEEKWEKFHPCHAEEVRAFWQEDQNGLRRVDALELVNKWNRLSPNYRYLLHV